MAFLDVTFPKGVAAGVTGGPARGVDITTLVSGDEERNARWKHSRRSWQAGLAVRSLADLEAVTALFEEAGGALHSFRFRDWTDCTSAAGSAPPAATDQQIGTGDGITTDFSLVKHYGTLQPYARAITKPIAGSVKVAVDGTATPAGWSVDPLTGIVSFAAAPAAGAIITAGFDFDVPVRFDTEQIITDLSFFSDDAAAGLGSVPEIPLIEVRE